MPSCETAGRVRVDRSTSPLSHHRPANPVQELKALFSEPPLSTRVINGGNEQPQDFRLDAVQCLQLEEVRKQDDDVPERGSWGSKVKKTLFILL